jgi:uncharacterized protein (TIGR03437 family)
MPCRRFVPGLTVLALAVGASMAGQSLKFDWRRIGNTALDLSLAGVATGSVERVWYSADGSRLFARTGKGRVFTTPDFEAWSEAGSIEAPAAADVLAFRPPEPSARVRGEVQPGTRLYAFGKFVYRSDDAGTSWSNLTGFKNSSLIGEGLSDLAISPNNADEIVVAANSGVWRSVDGGLSWTGLNDALPNLRSRRILALPGGVRGMRVAVDTAGSLSAWEWNPGEKQAWRSYDGAELKLEEDLKLALGSALKTKITAVSISGDYVYLGSAAGQLWASADRGRTWAKAPDVYAAPVERIWLDARDPRLALAAMGAPSSNAASNAKTARVLRTINGGGFWDDLTADLPEGAVHGIAADRSTGAIYAGTSRGLYMTYGDLIAAGPATPWTSVTDGLPAASVQDVALDPAGNQLYAAFDGYGIYGAGAPHRSRDPRVVSAADFSARAAAPGALLSVLGANLRTAKAGSLNAPILAIADGKTEIQVPFEASGANLALSLEGAAGVTAMGLALRPTSPGIFVDRDGTPMLLDGDSGVLLDAMTPARSNGRIQILATGLGRVRPEWPAGTPAPADNAPRVVAQVKAYLDREPVEVTRAILAPGYVGFYLVEIQMPKIVNYGPAELYIETDGQGSNRVRLYIEP